MNEAIIEWLLEESNPSVRYFTLTKLLDKSQNDPIVQKAKKNIMQSSLVVQLLKEQNPDGSWGEEERFYTDKYTGSVWTLLLLAELGADPSHPQIKKACEFILNHSQDPLGFGFSIQQSAKTRSGLPGVVIPCLTGNMVFALIRLGYLQDERVQKAIEWILKYQQTDDGFVEEPREKIVERLTTCFGKHSCHMGVAKALKALNEIPIENRNQAITDKLNQLSEYFLIHHIYKKSHDLSQTCKPGWLKFGFPLMYQTDVLELLEIMADLQIKDSRLNDSLTQIQKKKNPDGNWNMENSFNGKMRLEIEKKDFPSKWITLKALRVEKFYKVEK